MPDVSRAHWKQRGGSSLVSKLEFEAARDYYERTGRNYWKRNLVEQRKIVEQYIEKQSK